MSGRILIVEDVPTNRLLLKSKLSLAYYDVTSADTGQEALSMANSEQPDIVLLDLELSDMCATKVCNLLKQDPATAHIPVVFLTSQNCKDQRLLGLEAGADDLLRKPVDDTALFARLRSLMRLKLMHDELRMRDATARNLGLDDFTMFDRTPIDQPSKLLLVPRDETHRYVLSEALANNVMDAPGSAWNEDDAVKTAQRMDADLIVVAQNFADHGNGLRLISNLRANPATRQVSILFIANEGDIKAAATALDLGATDYVFEDPDMREIKIRARMLLERKHNLDRLRSNVIDGLRLAVLDPLTGIYNRRYATRHIQSMIERATQDKGQVSVMMLDLDNFKSVNDRFGHDAGDAVLQEFAKRLQSNVRGVDLVARLGGEEFCVAMPESDGITARKAAERVRVSIEQVPFQLPFDKGLLDITVSVGVAVSLAGDLSVEEALRNADFALYASKHRGRNRVSLFKQAA